jgi:hypothetical protein
MFDKSKYLISIEHAKGTEKSELIAYKLDDADGIAEQIGFNSNIINKVDYFVEQGLDVQLIELSDLRQQLEACNIRVKQAKTTFDEINKNPELSKKEKFKKKQALIDDVWQSLRDEFQKKWNGSIAVIERLYRKTNQSADNDPKYSLLIVCKNETDARMLDELNTELGERLKGSCGIVKKVQFCKTSHLNQYLLNPNP